MIGDGRSETFLTGVMVMRFSEPVRMADGDHGPVWARTKKRGAAGPFVSVLVTLLGLFGALTLVLGIKEKSVAEGGAVIDGWVAAGRNAALTAAGKAPEKAGHVASRTGDALAAGAQGAADERRKE